MANQKKKSVKVALICPKCKMVLCTDTGALPAGQLVKAYDDHTGNCRNRNSQLQKASAEREKSARRHNATKKRRH